jgi:hypothetical protein
MIAVCGAKFEAPLNNARKNRVTENFSGQPLVTEYQSSGALGECLAFSTRFRSIRHLEKTNQVGRYVHLILVTREARCK